MWWPGRALGPRLFPWESIEGWHKIEVKGAPGTELNWELVNVTCYCQLWMPWAGEQESRLSSVTDELQARHKEESRVREQTRSSRQAHSQTFQNVCSIKIGLGACAHQVHRGYTVQPVLGTAGHTRLKGTSHGHCLQVTAPFQSAPGRVERDPGPCSFSHQSSPA